ncbi:MAG: molecular chaperone [Neisseriaceae bacterium]|nr:molecular chaperone [Neisseriaceae bacterium]
MALTPLPPKTHRPSLALALALMLGCLMAASMAVAGVMPNQSRIVYPQNSPFQSLLLVNANPYPVVVQLWINEGQTDAAPEHIEAPFLATPAMSKLEANQIKEIKVFNTQPQQLHDQHEQLYWLNILEVPPTPTAPSDSHLVGLSMLTQMKILYRPQALRTSSEAVLAQLAKLQFSLIRTEGTYALKVENPSAYVANIANIELETNSQQTFRVETDVDKTVLPHSQQIFNLSAPNATFSPSQRDVITFTLVNDEGQYVPLRRLLPTP